MHGWMNAWMYIWMHGWMDGWMDGCPVVQRFFHNRTRVPHYVHVVVRGIPSLKDLCIGPWSVVYINKTNMNARDWGGGLCVDARTLALKTQTSLTNTIFSQTQTCLGNAKFPHKRKLDSQTQIPSRSWTKISQNTHAHERENNLQKQPVQKKKRKLLNLSTGNCTYIGADDISISYIKRVR